MDKRSKGAGGERAGQEGQHRPEGGEGGGGLSSSEPGVSSESAKSGSETESSDKKFRISCSEAGQADCSLVIIGTEDEVIECGVAHAVKSHGMQDDEKLRADLRSMIKEDDSTFETKGDYGEQGRGQSGTTGLPA